MNKNVTVNFNIFWPLLWAVQIVLVILKLVGVAPFATASWGIILIPFWLWLFVVSIFLTILFVIWVFVFVSKR